MAYTREIYRITENGGREYSGLARFDNEGNYLGSRGGYGGGGRSIGGRNRNGGSKVQNYIRTAAARGRRRNPYL